MAKPSRFLPRAFALLLPVGLFALNAWVVRGWFTGEYPGDLSAIDTAYVQAVRLVAESAFRVDWVPVWYGGFPLHVIYNPAMPFLGWLVQAATHLPFGQVERVLGAAGYAATPAALFLFVRALTRRTGAALAAGLGATFLPSIGYALFRDANGGGPADYAALFGNGPWRFSQLTQFGEATHSFAMPLVPLAGWAFLRLLDKPGFGRVAVAGAALAAVALSSMIALLATLVLLLGILAARLLVGAKPSRTLGVAGIAAAVAFGLSAFWFNAQFLAASFQFGEGSSVLGNYLKGFGIAPLAVAVVFGILYWVFHRRARLLPLLTAFLWFIPLFAFAFVWYRYRLALAPQPIRYIPEMDLALLTLGAAALAAVLDALPRSRLGRVIGVVFTAAALVGAALPGRAFVDAAPRLTAPRAQPVEESYEYQTARRIAGTAGDQRVYVSGNAAFYLDAFSQTPQLRGALDQAAVNRWWTHLSYQLLTNEASVARGEAQAVATAIVRAMDLHYVLVESGGSGDPFRTDWKHPEVYAGWPAVWSERGDTLYRTPLSRPGLFQAVPATTLERLRAPRNGADLAGLSAYAEAVDGTAAVAARAVRWPRRDTAQVEVTLRPGDAVSGQLTFTRGWTARSSAGGSARVKPDALGNLYLDGLPPGPQTVTLRYRKPFGVYFGYAITLLTLIGLASYPRWIRPWWGGVRARAAAAAAEERRLHREELRKLGINVEPSGEGTRTP